MTIPPTAQPVKPKGGRPAGRTQDARLLLRLREDLLERVRVAAEEDGVTVSELVRHAIGSHLRSRAKLRSLREGSAATAVEKD